MYRSLVFRSRTREGKQRDEHDQQGQTVKIGLSLKPHTLPAGKTFSASPICVIMGWSKMLV
ncbi:hypothetical protein MICAF_5690005 [Microcystis aeruginosa PCC 9807]|uniref:Uncharacterized protein n=1 Tax=Microcystis aeruginosa PCC 9807 TaxID=1160283 RepID=I4HD44_MICAE|nr:MAG: hypothetical protein EWV83_07040 [Microcystis sp. M_OC_Ca_00000000_S217Cul]TRT86678.1 MAG: hypothetical protein EWV66_15670 [Microcystis sp. M_OC_Ca_00000000_C217Col]CCI19968.1 hypothetical protein MICAF_5690005 [Microcystis aeruginosa PCC 9807]